MTDSIKRVTLNGISGGPATAAPWIGALNDERVVLEKAGFLFKAALSGDHLLLAVEPCLINGERRYHFNMRLAQEDAYTLIGCVDAQGVFTILVKPESRVLSGEQCARYREVFRAFAGLLLACGYTGQGLLDEVTQAVLKQVGQCPVPDRLAGLREG